MVRSAVSESEVIAMEPRDAWLIEKIDEMKAQRKAAAFDRDARPKTHRERLRRFEANGLPTSLQFGKEVRACL
jgi:hypothetical protein